jgi:hypothetical protein
LPPRPETQTAKAGSSGETDVPETVSVELSPNRIEVEPGAKPVDAAVGLRNLTGVVSQYTIEIADIEQDWFTIPVPSVGLFPQDREQVRISFHPPKRGDLRAGEYPFRILVRGRGGVQEQSAEGVLDIRGFAVYRLDLMPRRMTDHDLGEFKLVISNTGTADIRVAIEARDEEDACIIKFPQGDEYAVEAGSRVTVPFLVQPKRRPWAGPDHPYNVIVTARPKEARGLPQSLTAQFVHRPHLPSWAPVWNVLKVLGIVFAVLALVVLLVVTPIGATLLRSARIFLGPICAATLGQVPVVGRAVCSTIILQTTIPDLPNRTGQAGVTGATGATAAAPPPPADPCEFSLGFKEFADAFPGVVGACAGSAQYDVFGNVYQNTGTGMLIWQKGTNRIYLLSGSRTYTYAGGQVQVIDSAPPGLPGR